MRKKRLFIAAFPPHSVRRMLISWQQDLPGEWRVQDENKLHMTILYIGEVSTAEETLVTKLFNAKKGSVDTCELTISPTCVNGLEHAAHVCAVTAKGTDGELSPFRNDLSSELSNHDIVHNNAAWLPHITLAYAQTAQSVPDFAMKESIAWTLDELSLVASEVTHSGSHYDILSNISL